MKILFLCPSLDFGGAERQLVACANGLAERGHTLAVALFYAGGGLEAELSPKVKLIQLNKTGRWDLIGFTNTLLGHVRAFRPDVLYSILGTPNLIAGLLKPLIPSCRLAWSVRASDIDLSRYGLVSRLAAGLEVFFSGKADRIIANSEAGLSHAVSRGMPKEKLYIVHNGIDTNHFIPDREQGARLRKQWMGDGTTLVGIVARLDPMKDHENLLQAAKNLKNTHPGLRFVCIGSGPLDHHLQARCAKLGLKDMVVWAGSHKDMVAAYNALDICCLPSAFGEGFPNVLGEAMACDIPCVATTVGDSQLIIGDTGFTALPRSHKSLAEALQTAINKPSSTSPRQQILQYFSLEAMIAKTEKLLTDIAKLS